ncbi:hypothetical protein [Burkholderia sp. YIM B11467]
MNEIKRGGPAFPIADPFALNPRDQAEMERLASGMTLCDYFATHIDVHLEEYSVGYAETIVGRKMPDYATDPTENAAFWAEFRATMRYIEASAMLRARDDA